MDAIKQKTPGPEAIKYLCSTQLSTKFILLINVKMPTIVEIVEKATLTQRRGRVVASRFWDPGSKYTSGGCYFSAPSDIYK